MMRMVLVGLAFGTAVLAVDLSSSVTFSKDGGEPSVVHHICFSFCEA
jgi:hypothetical protein